MSFNTKALLAALAFGFATQAGAKLTDGALGNGGVALIVWDDTPGIQRSFTQSLGIDLNTLAGASSSLPPFTLDPLFNTAFAGSNPANLLWDIVAADSIAGTGVDPKRLLSSQRVASGAPGTVSNSAVSNAA